LKAKKLVKERRKWPRLSLAIPVFVRSRDERGKDLLEFATALNVSAGGFLGWGLIGVALSQLSQPAAVAFAAVGAVRSVYSSFLAKGHEVSFAVDTPIQVRLAPGPSRAQ